MVYNLCKKNDIISVANAWKWVTRGATPTSNKFHSLVNKNRSKQDGSGRGRGVVNGAVVVVVQLHLSNHISALPQHRTFPGARAVKWLDNSLPPMGVKVGERVEEKVGAVATVVVAVDTFCFLPTLTHPHSRTRCPARSVELACPSLFLYRRKSVSSRPSPVQVDIDRSVPRKSGPRCGCWSRGPFIGHSDKGTWAGLTPVVRKAGSSKPFRGDFGWGLYHGRQQTKKTCLLERHQEYLLLKNNIAECRISRCKMHQPGSL